MIKIRDFSKAYHHDFVAVRQLNMTVARGDIFGFIGPNGAGKSTTIRFLATLLKPTQGKATVAGFDVVREVLDVRQSIGFMPDSFGVFDGMQVWEFLDFFAAAYGILKDKRKRIIEDVLDLVDLGGKRTSAVESLSRGMKQRLCLAKTLVHDPPVLILDEPASGLDPRARIEMKELLRELQRMGKTILISSHILSELADCCNRVGIIERGDLKAAGTIEEILANVRDYRRFHLRVLTPEVEAERTLSRFSSVRGIRTAHVSGAIPVMELDVDGDDTEISQILEALVRDGTQLSGFREIEPNLEDVFMKETRGEVQ